MFHLFNQFFMANTYTQIHIQAVFAVKHRNGLILDDWSDDLYKYITGIIQNHTHKVLAINGMPDHIHCFFGMRPTQSISDLLQKVKECSTKWINDNNLTKKKFAWQEGYGAFSYSKSQCQSVIDYVRNQKEHHKGTQFLDEYIHLLEENEIEYDPKYIFHRVDYDQNDLKRY